MDSLQVQRVTTRVALELLLSIFREFAGLTNNDWLRAFVLLSIEASNWEHLNRSRGSWSNNDVCVGKARPVSRLSLSDSLYLPRETVRRVVTELIADNLCAVDGGGIVMNASPSNEARLRPIRAEVHRAVLEFVDSLEKLGLTRDAREESQRFSGSLVQHASALDEASVYRAALHFASLVCAHEKATYPSFQSAMLFNAIMVLNVRHITFDGVEAWRYSSADRPPPDSMRRPVRISEIAALLGVSVESCRRHLIVLEKAGLCVRSDGHVVVPTSAVQRPELITSGRRVHAWTMQFLVQLCGAPLTWRNDIQDINARRVV